MKIQRSTLYSVNLFQEPNFISDHSKNSNGTLTFTGKELIGAIISAGMPDTYLTKNERINRSSEIFFKINLFETYVVSSPAASSAAASPPVEKLSFDVSKKKYLDSTEVGAINYWIGMILVTVLGQKKYHYDFMVHLSLIQSLSSTVNIKKRSFFSVNGKIIFKSPDLLAVNCLKNSFGIFESKGYTNYSKAAMESGYMQAKSIKKVNGKSPAHRLVVMVQTGGKEILLIEKDPDGDDCALNMDLDFLYLYHFLPVVELISELNPEKSRDWIRGSLKHGDDCYSISIPLDLYEILFETAMGRETLDAESVFKGLLKEAVLSRLISEKTTERILCVE